MSTDKDLDKIFHDLSKNIRKEKLILNEIIYKRDEDEMNILVKDMTESIKKIQEDWKSYLKLIG